MEYDYCKCGFALVGSLVSNCAGTNYSEYLSYKFFKPLGMQHTVWDIGTVPAEQRAIGYRWENEAWMPEPVLGPGAFGAMGGVITTANDYARYVAWLLAAWPPRDGAEDAILRRSSVREIARPANYAIVFAPTEPSGCARGASYGFGMIPFYDCVLGFHFGHSGGLPGYGSNVLFLPERGIAVFAFTNRTYGPVSRAVRVKFAHRRWRRCPVGPGVFVTHVNRLGRRVGDGIVVPRRQAVRLTVAVPAAAGPRFADHRAEDRIRHDVDPRKRRCRIGREVDRIFAAIHRESAESIEVRQLQER